MEEVQEERPYSWWERFFYIFLIPALFASILGGVLLNFSGYDVVGMIQEQGNSIPVIEKIIPGSNEAEEAQPQTNPVEELQAKLQQKDEQIVQLEKDLAEKEATIKAIEEREAELEKMLEDKQADEAERQQQYQDLAKLYTSMSSRNAASIIGNLSLEEAVAVMSKMKPDDRADILSKMDPKKAADISVLFKDSVISKDDDIALLQQRINALTKALSETRPQSAVRLDSLVTSFSQMAPNDAAAILITMMGTNQSNALSILAEMANDKRAQVLAAISAQNQAMAAKISSALLR
ncbi:MotE family protein [Brevibacillus humidisoli]|uniref:MotE family protein n=1 Tax=Brevibacillus humidisoli TaxID=2895522 RepID=UPI001E526050|nr:MotE family protein [Brevibacillus humidisoli]UFJ42129.1 MotE family protein [Brevibacillus humidisoli]